MKSPVRPQHTDVTGQVAYAAVNPVPVEDVTSAVGNLLRTIERSDHRSRTSRCNRVEESLTQH